MSVSKNNAKFRSGMLVAAAAVVLLGSSAAHAELTLDQQMEKAMWAVFNGPTAKKLKVNKHHFNVKKSRVVQSGNVVIVEGTISHHLNNRRDDQVEYKIRKEGGAVKEMKIKIKRGGFAPIGAKIAAVLGQYVTGTPLPADKIEGLGRKLGRKIDGDWESTAELLVTHIGMRADSTGRDGLVAYRASLQQRPPSGAATGTRRPARRPTASGKNVSDHRTSGRR